MKALKLTSILTLCFLFSIKSNAQSNVESDPLKLSKVILHHDSIFWKAYNSCDADKMESLLTDDLEFYHDKGGLTLTSAKLVEVTKNNLCNSNKNWRLRREVVPGSVQVFPLNNFGAILTGEHVFYVLEDGKPERLDGLAKFTHVWKFDQNQWKMSRVLSYDHKPAPQNYNSKTPIALSDKILKSYVGKYEGTQTKVILVNKSEGSLELQAGEFKGNIYPETENLFFSQQKNLSFEFVKDSKNQIVKLIVRENGNVAEEAKRIK